MAAEDVVNPANKDDARREERAQRILDAALTLILRWGYNKTTIDDISRQAEVAKGTIYLHWKTREELFEALILREKAEVFKDIQQRIQGDPDGWTLRGIFKHTALATIQRPLIKALFLGDKEILGKLANSEMSTTAYTERVDGFKAYLELLRQQGLVRTDLSIQEEVFVWSTAMTGFFFAPTMMPAEFVPSDEVSAGLLAEMVHRSLETDQAISPEAYQTVFNELDQYVTHSNGNALDASNHANEKE